MMNPEIKAKWIADLTIGRYKQAHGMLETQAGAMCCLGVEMACQGKTPAEYFNVDWDVNWASATTHPGDWTTPSSSRSPEALHDNTLPDDVAAGLTAVETTLLALLNDGSAVCGLHTTELAYKWGVAYQIDTPRRHTFAEIAAIIERNL